MTRQTGCAPFRPRTGAGAATAVVATVFAALWLVAGCAQAPSPTADDAAASEPTGGRGADSTGADGTGSAQVPPPKTQPAAESGDDAVSKPMERQAVEVYFPSAEDDGLVAEAREIFVTTAPGDRAKQIVADLISGPTTDLALEALPRGTRLRQIYVLDDGTAYVDFSHDLRDGLGGGSSEERLTIYSIIDSIVLNVPEIRRVGFLIDGEPIESLNGHLDLRHPLRPDLSVIVGRVASRDTDPSRDGTAEIAAARLARADSSTPGVN